MATARRLAMEHEEIMAAESKAMDEETSIGWSIGPASDESILKWQGSMDGPAGTPYEGGRFELTVDFPADYPFNPPKVLFTTKIYHHGVDASGKLCLLELQKKDVGGSWDAACKISQIMVLIQSMLMNPGDSVDHPLVPEIAEQYMRDRAAFNKVRQKVVVVR